MHKGEWKPFWAALGAALLVLVVLCMHPAPLPFCREYGPLCRNYAACGLCSCVRPGFVLW